MPPALQGMSRHQCEGCRYDHSCSQHPAPLSRGVAPPLSLALPRSLASEDSRQTLHSTSSSFTDRERIPVVNI
ncbi:hypothetical protein EYF80_008090 [Liparis tanakae]|uniref:Uncharacterized protein n=1 Tax=Liparis tanakae TaxID=230148 RepID=A0A4Z2IVR6_9TELE|nr:hypothetical protein EYF80_008090 [Liparis tanakae]